MRDECQGELAAVVPGDLRPWTPSRREAEPLVTGPLDPFSCLTEVQLFADLSAKEIAAMDLMAPARLFRRGELLFSQSQPDLEVAADLFGIATSRVPCGGSLTDRGDGCPERGEFGDPGLEVVQLAAQ